MNENYSKEEVKKIVDALKGYISYKEIVSLVSNEETLRLLHDYSDPSIFYIDEYELQNRICKELSERIEKEQIKAAVMQLPSQVSMEFVECVLRNPELLKQLSLDERTEIILATENAQFIEDVMNDPSVDINDKAAKEYLRAVVYGDDFEWDDEIEEIEEPQEFKALQYTQEEVLAVKVYEATDVYGDGPLTKNTRDSYRIMNTMLFPGIENELARTFDDKKILRAAAIRDPKELLELSESLYSAMYKFGKKMNSPLQVKRIDRAASFQPIEESGEIVSNFSTTLNDEFDTVFTKANMMLVDAEVLPGTPCLDFQHFFNDVGEEYDMEEEAELLIAPFSPIEMEKVELSERELKIKDMNKKPPVGKMQMVIRPPQEIKSLSLEEQKNKQEMMGIFWDAERREKAASVLEKIVLLSRRDPPLSKEEALAELSEEEIENYVGWKNAFQTVLRYRTREIALEIDKALAEERGETIEEVDDNLLGRMDTMAQTRTLTGLNTSISKAKEKAQLINKDFSQEIEDDDRTSI